MPCEMTEARHHRQSGISVIPASGMSISDRWPPSRSITTIWAGHGGGAVRFEPDQDDGDPLAVGRPAGRSNRHGLVGDREDPPGILAVGVDDPDAILLPAAVVGVQHAAAVGREPGVERIPLVSNPALFRPVGPHDVEHPAVLGTAV